MKMVKVIGTITMLAALTGCSSNVIGLNDKMVISNISADINNTWSISEDLTRIIGATTYYNKDECVLTDYSSRTLQNEDVDKNITDSELNELSFKGYNLGSKEYDFKSKDGNQKIEMSVLIIDKYPYEFLEDETSFMKVFRYSIGDKNTQAIAIDIHCPAHLGIKTELLDTFSFKL